MQNRMKNFSREKMKLERLLLSVQIICAICRQFTESQFHHGTKLLNGNHRHAHAPMSSDCWKNDEIIRLVWFCEYLHCNANSSSRFSLLDLFNSIWINDAKSKIKAPLEFYWMLEREMTIICQFQFHANVYF